MKTSKLIVTPSGFKTWELTEDFVVETKAAGKITVPAGRITDLASTPRILWSILPPFGRYSQAAVVHDYLYSLPEFDRKTADLVFYELMITYKTFKYKALTMYWAVRIFGGLWR